ncbi:WAT1-related protein At3g30340-like isoform X1 [Momordica charantia]|uniref:WAT1-related protein n=1 Tax=Momordica charantia TaxID=3673 RepID=A0A6J1CEV7_MOMCH|nr:WAT1-related protein At3g30340-like isoform X1 [Momordica charantia]
MKPVVVMLSINLALAGVNILLKEILSEGISQLVIVMYRQTISALFLSPIAYFWERKTRPQLTAYILFLLFISSLVGLTLTLYLFLIGLQYTSATFSCAFLNLVPVNTFILAVLFGMEKVDMKSKGGRAKVLGTLVCISGNLILILYKGMPLTSPGSATGKTNGVHPTVQPERPERWLIGSLVLTAGCFMWSSWFLMQSRVGKVYPCQYSSTCIMSFFSAIQSVVLHLIIDTKNSVFVVKGKSAILSLIYAGSVGSGLCYVGMSWCVKKKGPVFTAAFTPFMELFAAIFDFFILHEQIHLGSVVGSVLIISGMYILLWGKDREAKECAVKQTVSVEEGYGDSTIPSSNTNAVEQI